jgi:uncharacterized protein
MHPMFAKVLSDVLAGYLILFSPWLGVYQFRKAEKRIHAALPGAKIRLYRQTVLELAVLAFAVIAVATQIPPGALGFVQPRSWALAISIFVLAGAAVVWSSLRARPMADKIRKQARKGGGFLLFVPETSRDRIWYGAVSVSAGISEELVYRGFLLYYLALYLPQFNALERGLVAALLFGLAHLYQGWKGAAGAGILGLAFVGVYALTGSLLLPIAVHIAVDWRLLLMLPPIEPQPALAEASI